jgi:hypothetical protein
MVLLAYIAVFVLAVAGLVALARRRGISGEEYEAMKGKQSRIGNALLDAQVLVEPEREALRKAKQERRVEEDESGDPPSPGP